MQEVKIIMSKGVVILKALKAKRRLREICKSYDISYKYAHAISEGLKKPSYDFIMNFKFLIPTDFWFEKAEKEFIEKLKQAVNSEK